VLGSTSRTSDKRRGSRERARIRGKEGIQGRQHESRRESIERGREIRRKTIWGNLDGRVEREKMKRVWEHHGRCEPRREEVGERKRG